VRWWRVVCTAARLMGPNWYRPWRSELLRWRMETYGVKGAQGQLLRAHDITPRIFQMFVRQHRVAMWRFLAWAADVSVGR